MLKVCASRLDPDYFIKTVLERFHVRELLTFVPLEKRNKKKPLQSEHEMPMLEGALSLLTVLLSVRTQLGKLNPELNHGLSLSSFSEVGIAISATAVSQNYCGRDVLSGSNNKCEQFSGK